MDAAKWVAKAVGKDVTRAVLLVSWRQDKIRWATDGHRLHLAPDPDQPPGVTMEPPDAVSGVTPAPYRRVIPDGAGVRLGPAGTKALRRLVKQADDAGPKRQRREVVLVTASEPARLIVVARKPNPDEKVIDIGRTVAMIDGEIIGSVALESGECWAKIGLRVCLNVGFLIEAMAGTGAIRILISGDARGLDPIKISHDDGRIAIVMPMRM